MHVFSLCEVSQRHPRPPQLISDLTLRERAEHVGGKESDVALLPFKQLFIAHGVCPAVGETIKQEYLFLKYIVELVFSIISLLTQ